MHTVTRWQSASFKLADRGARSPFRKAGNARDCADAGVRQPVAQGHARHISVYALGAVAQPGNVVDGRARSARLGKPAGSSQSQLEAAFGTAVDYAQITKKYVSDSSLPDAAHRYSPGHVSGVDRTVIRGNPKSENISTSYVERFNLSSRMGVAAKERTSHRFSYFHGEPGPISIQIRFGGLSGGRR